MSWAGGASTNNVRPVSRGEQPWDPANPAASLQSVYRRVGKHASGVIDWYLNAKRSKRVLAPGKATEVPFTR